MSSFRINTNIQAQQAFQNLQNSNEQLSSLRERLTTGKRINEASDDAAGFEIANQLESKTGAQGEALRNIGDAKSLLSTAEGSLDSQLDILQTMKEKATQAANDSLSTDERSAIQGELNELTSELQDISENTEFNGQQLIASGGNDLTFQTGASETDTFDVTLNESTALSSGLGVGSDTSSVTDGAGSLKNTTFNENNVAGLSLADNGGNVTLEGNDNNSIKGGSSSVLDGNSLKNLDGGTFDLEITTDDTSDANSGFQVSVNGGGEQQLSAASGAVEADQNVTLEFDAESGDGIQLAFDGADAKALNDSIKNAEGKSVNVDLEVGGDGVEFTNDVTKSSDERENAIKNIDSAIKSLTTNLSDIGATQNRLSFKEGNLETARTNLESARSRIEDADFAQTQTQVAKLQVQQQSGTAQLAQANAAGQSVLSLLQG